MPGFSLALNLVGFFLPWLNCWRICTRSRLQFRSPWYFTYHVDGSMLPLSVFFRTWTKCFFYRGVWYRTTSWMHGTAKTCIACKCSYIWLYESPKVLRKVQKGSNQLFLMNLMTWRRFPSLQFWLQLIWDLNNIRCDTFFLSVQRYDHLIYCIVECKPTLSVGHII
jgi:hypothetical protein